MLGVWIGEGAGIVELGLVPKLGDTMTFSDERADDVVPNRTPLREFRLAQDDTVCSVLDKDLDRDGVDLKTTRLRPVVDSGNFGGALPYLA